MGREHVEFVDSREMPWRPAALPGFGDGARKKVLSEDSETGAATLLLSLPAGWRRDAVGYYGMPEEVFVLEGDLAVGPERLAVGCYSYLPPGMAHGPLASTAGCLALVMFEGRPEFVESADHAPGAELDGHVPCIDTIEMPWSAPRLEGPPPGILIKMLRADPDRGDQTWLAAVLPLWRENRAEVHPTVEEAFMLQGETLLGKRGVMRGGCYFWRPPNVPHGPMISKTGGIWFFRTKGGSLEVTYTEPPGWEETVRKYLDAGPVFDVAPDEA
jgi:hypothetical protein